MLCLHEICHDLQEAASLEAAINKKQYEATLAVATELYPDIHSKYETACVAQTVLFSEQDRLRTELAKVEARLASSKPELAQLHAKRQRTAQSLLQRLETSRPGHDCLRDVTLLLREQHLAAAASFVEANGK